MMVWVSSFFEGEWVVEGIWEEGDWVESLGLLYEKRPSMSLDKKTKNEILQKWRDKHEKWNPATK